MNIPSSSSVWIYFLAELALGNVDSSPPFIGGSGGKLCSILYSMQFWVPTDDGILLLS